MDLKNDSPTRPQEDVQCYGTVEFTSNELRQTAETRGVAAAWAQAAGGGRQKFAEAARSARGSFSAVVRGRGYVALVVDRFAIYTLCWRLLDGTVHTGTRADVLGDQSPSADVDVQAIFDYLHTHVIPAPRTIYEGVSRVPAGHVVWIEGGVASAFPYWTPHFSEPGPAPDFRALQSEFMEILSRSVARRAESGKAACYLSGGTDSSTVAGLLAKQFGQVSTFSIGFEAEGYDEMLYARIAAKRFNTVHHEHYVTPAEVLAGMPRVAAAFDQPFGNSSAVPAFYCAQMAKNNGTDSLLAGDGGDELFGGNARYAKQRLFEFYTRVPAVMRRTLEQVVKAPGIRASRIAGKAESYLEQAREPMPDRLELYNLLARVGFETVLSSEFLGRVDPSVPLKQQRAVWRQTDKASWLNRHLAFDWRYTLAEADLPKVIGSASLAGVSVGFPLLDDELLDFSCRLPDDYKLRGGQLRWFFKEALRGFLPDEIITKKKHGFGLPFGVWTVRDEQLRSSARALLDSLVHRGIVKDGFAPHLMDRLLPEHPGYYGELVWILSMLELWFQHARPDWRLADYT